MLRTFDLKGPAAAHIAIEGGAVEVETIDGTQARVDVMRERGGEPGDEVNVEVRETNDGPELVLELRSNGGFLRHFGHDRDLYVRVQLPHGSRLRVGTASADVTARGTYSGAWFQTASGDMKIGRINGNLEMKSASGDIEGEFVAGNLAASSASGDISMRRTEGEVAVRTASGDVEIKQLERASVSVKSASGDITIGVRRGARVWLDVRSLSGETESELDMTDASETEEGPLVEIRAMSMSGDIRIQRAQSVLV